MIGVVNDPEVEASTSTAPKLALVYQLMMVPGELIAVIVTVPGPHRTAETVLTTFGESIGT